MRTLRRDSQRHPANAGAGVIDLTILVILLAVLVAVLLMVMTFSGERYGELRPNEEVTRAFDAARIDPGKDYYFSGSDLYPTALLGIDRSWTLESDLWKKRNLTAPEMGELVGNMRSKAREHGGLVQGFDILDDRGRKIGEWLSPPGLNVVVWMKGSDRVAISTPTPPANPDR